MSPSNPGRNIEPTAAYAGSDWGGDVLAPWAAAHEPILAALGRVGQPRMAAVALAGGDLKTLYALSRVVELLILPFQPPAPDGDDDGERLPLAAYQQFITAVGGTFARVDRFHPFLHEIVAVEPAQDRSQPPSLVRLWWPGCMVGSLLLMRAGVTVRAGADHLDAVVAAGSTLYWAWWRRHRPVEDLSHGWGSNSQWRTRFRRDYWLPDRLAYNVDAALTPDRERPDNAPDNADTGLLRHRCSTIIDHGADVGVWHQHATEPAPLQLDAAQRMRCYAEELADGLEGLDDVSEVWRLADARVAAGDAAFVADLGIALWHRYGSDPHRCWQYRSVSERVLRLLTLTPGRRNIEQALRMIAVTDGREPRRHAAALLAAGQSIEDLAVVFTADDRPAGADDELRSLLVQELVLRGVQVDNTVAVARWLARSPRHGAVDILPAALTALEGQPRLPRHRLDATSYPGAPAAGDGAPVPASGGGVHGAACRETTTPQTAEAIGAAVANWAEQSNGRFEAHTYDLAEDLAVDAIAGTVAGLDLRCLQGTPAAPQIRQCSPDRAWQMLFTASSAGGAYNRGEGGALGRLAAWRSVAALTGAPLDAPISEVERRALACSWYTFDTTSSWFDQDGWDIALIAVAPDRRHLAILAATDTD